MADDDDELVFAEEAARMAGIAGRTFRKYVQAQIAPPPDDPDLDRPAARRMQRWKRSTIRAWTANRTGRGYRSDLIGKPFPAATETGTGK